jgi:hypothetical protein
MIPLHPGGAAAGLLATPAASIERADPAAADGGSNGIADFSPCVPVGTQVGHDTIFCDLYHRSSDAIVGRRLAQLHLVVPGRRAAARSEPITTDGAYGLHSSAGAPRAIRPPEIFFHTARA